jgi:hypothetical protein
MNIRRLFELDWEVTISHSYREANWWVDALANMGCDLDCNVVFLDLSESG